MRHLLSRTLEIHSTFCYCPPWMDHLGLVSKGPLQMSSSSALKVVSSLPILPHPLSFAFGLFFWQYWYWVLFVILKWYKVCCYIAWAGDPNVQTSQAFEAVFMNSGDNPFELIKDSIKYVSSIFEWNGNLTANLTHILSSTMCWHRILEKHKGTFSHIENKKVI